METLKKLIESLYAGILLYGSIAFVVIGATILAQSVSLLGVPQSILETVRSAGFGAITILAAVVFIYLILGCFSAGTSLRHLTFDQLRTISVRMTNLIGSQIWQFLQLNCLN